MAVAGAIVACSSHDTNGLTRDGGDAQSDVAMTDGSFASDGAVPDGGPSEAGRLSAGLLAGGGTTMCVVAHTDAGADGGPGQALLCWGNNDHANLGLGVADRLDHPSPAPAQAALTEYPTVAVGGYQTCAGAFLPNVYSTLLFCWGDDTYGELGHDPSLDVSPDASGCPSGTLCDPTPTPVMNLVPFIVPSVAVGYGGNPFTCYVSFIDPDQRPSGYVACWGAADAWHFGVADAGPPCADASSCSRTPVAIFGYAMDAFVEVVAGANHACARRGYRLDGDGTVWCWGENVLGQAGQPQTLDGGTSDPRAPAQVPGVTGAVALAAASSETCAIASDKTVRCWGSNQFGALGHPPGAGDTTCSSGVPCTSTPTTVTGLSDVRSIAVGFGHACAVRGDGKVLCWGLNQFGELGHDPASDNAGGGGPPWTATPTVVGGIGLAVEVAAASSTTCALLADGSVWCWGKNDSGLLGVTSNGVTQSFTPMRIPGL